MSDQQDWLDEALENNRRKGLPAKAPTELTRDGVTFTSTTEAGAAAWVDDVEQMLGLSCTEWEIDELVADAQRSMRILEKYFPDQDWRLLDAIQKAREEARSLNIEEM